MEPERPSITDIYFPPLSGGILYFEFRRSFWFSIYIPQNSYQVPGVQFSRLAPSLSVLISLQTSTLEQRAIPLTSSYSHSRYEDKNAAE